MIKDLDVFLFSFLIGSYMMISAINKDIGRILFASFSSCLSIAIVIIIYGLSGWCRKRRDNSKNI